MRLNVTAGSGGKADRKVSKFYLDIEKLNPFN
jgi:hypothetical protein